MGAELKGVNELLSKLREVRGTLNSIKPIVIDEMDNVVLAAKRHCPVDSGKLSEGIEVRDKSTAEEVRIAVGIFADEQIGYAIYVEYGTGIYAENGQGRKDPWVYPCITEDGLQFFTTVGNHPQPFIRPAWDEEKDNIVESVKKAATAELQRICA